MYKIGLISDIRQAFLNIGISEEHRDFLRFLYFDDVFSKDPIIVIFRFLRVVFGLTSSPFLLNGTIKVHMLKYIDVDRDFVEKFLRQLYVDDSANGVNSVEEGLIFYEKAMAAMESAGFQ